MKDLLPALLGGLLILTGCSSVPKRERIAVPQNLVNQAHIPGIPLARSWADEPTNINGWEQKTQAEIEKEYHGIIHTPHNYLAISGGGANGAYGAGLLVGWTATGKRPEFTLVTGISTGAIMAPFAFLGPEYDHVLIDLYTNKSTEEVCLHRGTLAGLRSDAFADNTPLRKLLNTYITEVEVQKLAAEYRKGRRLFISTVNLDAGRPVNWNIGEIAASGQPNTRSLIIDLIIASSSIPVAFPPVMINVEAHGAIYQELHVDGGLGSQIYVYPVDVHMDEIIKKLHPKGQPKLYLLRNAKLAPQWKETELKLMAIAARSLSSLVRTQGIGDLYRIYFTALRDKIDFNLAYIPNDFDQKATELFDKDYMKRLFNMGYQQITTNEHPWIKKLD